MFLTHRLILLLEYFEALHFRFYRLYSPMQKHLLAIHQRIVFLHHGIQQRFYDNLNDHALSW